jgi:putative transposase
VVHALHVHLVFVTGHRRGVLTGERIRHPNGISGELCSDLGAVLAECDGEHDHMHLLAGYRQRSPWPRW